MAIATRIREELTKSGTTSHQLTTTSHQLTTTSHQLTTTSHQLTTTSHQRTTNDYPACLASSSTSSSAFANRLARCTYEMLPAWLLRLSK
jgi:hypothetical protein